MRNPKYEIINHGPERSDYFQGCGTYGTPFKYCVTGIGCNAKEAYEDALDQVAEIDSWIIDTLPRKPRGIRAADKLSEEQLAAEEIYWHVSIRFGVEPRQFHGYYARSWGKE
jgi:hypothetical protein